MEVKYHWGRKSKQIQTLHWKRKDKVQISQIKSLKTEQSILVNVKAELKLKGL